MKQLTNKWVLVTGASSGFGVDYAHICAKAGAKLILTARRTDRLVSLKQELEAQYQAKVIIISCDLAAPGAIDQMMTEIEDQSIIIDALINNAGFGLYGDFLNTEWLTMKQMLDVDIAALTELTLKYSKEMAKRGQGYILLVASIGAYQATPTYAAYSAAKAYVLSLGEALNVEMKPKGVHVSVLSPGVTATEFLKVSGQKATLYQRLVMMQSRPVAMTGLRAMLKNKASVVPGFINKISVVSLRLLPRPCQAALAGTLMR